jgi:hypothetical protein
MHKFSRFFFQDSFEGRETTPAQARLLANLRLTALGVVYAGEDFEDPRGCSVARATCRPEARLARFDLVMSVGAVLH